jgi:hypothetical protein
MKSYTILHGKKLALKILAQISPQKMYFLCWILPRHENSTISLRAVQLVGLERGQQTMNAE